MNGTQNKTHTSLSGAFGVLILAAIAVQGFTACSDIGSWDAIRNLETRGANPRAITLAIDLSGTAWSNAADSSDIADFPLLVVLNTASDFDHPDRLGSSGSEIRFLDSGGNLLSFETIHYNPAGPSAWWVKVPGLDKSRSDNTIRVAYDYWWTDAPRRPDPGDTWSAGFVGVWHLDEPDGARVFTDSSTWMNHGITGVDQLGVPEIDEPPAALGFGSARFFDATTGEYPSFRIDSPADDSVFGPLEAFTLSCWMRIDDFGHVHIMEKGDIRLEFTGNRFQSYVFTDANPESVNQLLNYDNAKWSIVPPPPTWFFFALTSNGEYLIQPASGIDVFKNGTVISGHANNTPGSGSRNGNLDNPIQFFRQRNVLARVAADEIRLSRGTRSADWILLEYLNMSGVVNAVRVSESALE